MSATVASLQAIENMLLLQAMGALPECEKLRKGDRQKNVRKGG